jgi:hypothetical protein
MEPERRFSGRDSARASDLALAGQESWRESENPGGLGACVREDLMDLLIERNQLG